MTLRHQLWYANPIRSDEESAAAYVVGRPKLPNARVHIAVPSPQWPATFAAEAARIRELLGPTVIHLNHVGSTSVPGLPAKPVIDIDLVVTDSDDEQTYLPALESAGYRLIVREPEWEKHRCLRGPGDGVNLHVFSPDGREWRRHLLFRDWLRSHDADRARYGEHKRALGQRTWDYMQDYTNAKHNLIAEIMDGAYAAELAAHPEIGVDIPDPVD